MKVMLLLFCLSSSRASLCEKSPNPADNIFSRLDEITSWATKKRQELEKLPNTSGKVTYGFSFGFANNEKDFNLLQARIKLINEKLASTPYFEQIATCLIIGDVWGLFIKSKPRSSEITTAQWVKTVGLDRARLYTRVGKAFVAAQSVEALLKDFSLFRIHIQNGDMSSVSIDAVNYIFPMEPYLEETHQELRAENQVSDNVDKKNFYPKYFFKEFIDKTEKKRNQDAIYMDFDDVKKTYRPLPGFEPKSHPLPKCFRNLVKDMHLSRLSLEQVVNKMEEQIAKVATHTKSNSERSSRRRRTPSP